MGLPRYLPPASTAAALAIQAHEQLAGGPQERFRPHTPLAARNPDVTFI
jgi:hypothetical protein